jgi:nicotinic acid phosphoribosyltransferase
MKRRVWKIAEGNWKIRAIKCDDFREERVVLVIWDAPEFKEFVIRIDSNDYFIKKKDFEKIWEKIR